MKRMLFIAAITVLGLNASAKEVATPEVKTSVVNTTVSSKVVKGIVYDKSTNESLAGAVITANGQKVYSDLDGNFKIDNLCDGKCQLKISLISYKDEIIELDTRENSSIKIKLSQR